MRKYQHVIVLVNENGTPKEEIPASVRPSRAKRKLQKYVAQNARLEKRPISLKIEK